MSDMENIGRINDIEKFKLELLDAARRMRECENEVIKATEKIQKSFNTQGAKGTVNKPLLLTKMSDLERLAGLYRSTSEKYKDEAEKLSNGVSVDKVLAELHTYNIFLNDQLKSEKQSCEHVLNMLMA